jgi:DNA-binding NtrC family response regulator
MAKILIMDDEPLSLRRLFNVLCVDRQHDISTADDLPSGVKVVERLGTTLDVLIIDVSMFETISVDLLPLFANACPKATMLVITPLVKRSLGWYPQLRKPFADQEFVQAVNRVLAMPQCGVVEASARPKPPHSCRADGRLVQARALGR